MARGRMIGKRLCHSKKFAKLKSDRSRVLYTLFYTTTDREGRILADPEELKAECCPRLKYTIKQIAESVIDLADVGLVILYEGDDGEPYIEFVDFAEHQIGLRKDREAPSKIPAPDQIRSHSGVTPRKLKEYNVSLRKEGSKKENIFFDVEVEKWVNISQSDLNLWIEAYPAVDVKSELLAMLDWLISNPKNRKVNYRRFITNWLKRQQDRARGSGGRLEYKVSQVGKTRKEDETPPGWDAIAMEIGRKFKAKNKERIDLARSTKDKNRLDAIQAELEKELNVGLRKFREEKKDAENKT